MFSQRVAFTRCLRYVEHPESSAMPVCSRMGRGERRGFSTSFVNYLRSPRKIGSIGPSPKSKRLSARTFKRLFRTQTLQLELCLNGVVLCLQLAHFALMTYSKCTRPKAREGLQGARKSMVQECILQSPGTGSETWRFSVSCVAESDELRSPDVAVALQVTEQIDHLLRLESFEQAVRHE